MSINTIGHLNEHRCNPEMSLKYDRIFYRRVAYENQNLYNCSVPFHPPITSEITSTEIEICQDVNVGKKAFAHYSDSTSASILSPEDKPCAWFEVFLGLPYVDEHDNDAGEAYIRLYFKTEMKVKSIVIYYDATTFAAEVGGYIGVFLGVSIVDLVIIFNSALMKLVYRKFRKL